PLKHAGLALAIGLGACLNAALLYRQLRKRGIYIPQPAWSSFIFRLVLAVLAMAAALWTAMDVAAAWLAADAATRAARLAWLVALGAVVYFVVLWLFGFRLHQFVRRTEG
ncbi:MAG: lipid II flippase MurJ, partial [Burkholderiales bacterium]|nr:lipid II flippase MurJ [Burkholderiales bacterium]